MGVLYSCFHVPDVHDNAASNNSSSGNCLCPKCFFQKLKNKHGNIFRRGQTSALSSPNQQTSSNSGLVSNNSSNASWPRDGAQVNMFRQWSGVRERQEKGTRPLRVQPEPVGQSDIQVNPKSIQGNKEQKSESTAKVSSSGLDGIADTFSSPDNEDVCPTCLEDYTQENPKIIAKCSHHYHLSCIYEWMERSENCPACGKFDESS